MLKHQSRSPAVSLFIAVAVCALVQGGCNDDASDVAYVPDTSFQSTVTIDAPARAKVGEWIPLHAVRKSGPWKKVPKSQVRQGVIPLAKAPPEVEDNVQNNLQWVIDPPMSGQFNLPGTDSDATTRQVKFAKPGIYKLTGLSSYPAKSESNTISIEVE